MTSLLYDEKLNEREFGTHVFHVGDFLEWLKSKKLHISTDPAISDFEFVQVEMLLCAVQNAVRKLTFEEAYDEVAKDPRLSSDPAAEIAPVWLLAAEAPLLWRKDFAEAVVAGELQLLDVDSKRPIARNGFSPLRASVETPTERDDRRYRELLAMGGDYIEAVEGWSVTGPRGLLAKLTRKVKAAGEPMHDEKDVRESLKKAATRAKDARTAGYPGSSVFPRNMP